MIPTYPARPINGGDLPLARRIQPNGAPYAFEPKYNGWRTLVHAPSGAMFNRHGQRLTIQHEFTHALAILKAIGGFEWFDCEALDRRHGYGRGTLILLDLADPAAAASTYEQRRFTLQAIAAVHHLQVHTEYDRFPENSLLLTHTLRFGHLSAGDQSRWGLPVPTSDLALYEILKRCNRKLDAPVYEGVVAKRLDSKYPLQLRSSAHEFPAWVKHRWPF